MTNSATPDTIIGTDKNDTINGATGTVANGDLIIDQSTTDNDTANLVLTANYTPDNITNIENVNLEWDAYTTPTYDLGKVKGSKTVTLTSSKTGFLGNATVTGANDMTLVAGNGMVGDLNASGFKTGTVEATNSKKVVVTGTTTKADNASIVVNAGASTTDVTVGGATNGFKSTTVNAGTAGKVSVQDAGNTTDTTNVTVNKSAVNLTVNNAGATTLTTGADNVVTMDATSVIGTELTVKGEGNATLVFAADDLNTKKITNAKTSGDLIIKSADTDGEDISKVQATLVEFTAAQASGATTVATGANLKYSAAAGAINVTIAGTSTNDTATAELTASQTSVASTGVETLNIKANATATSGADLTIGTLTTGANKVVLTGTNDVALTTLVSTAGTVDATALVGDLTIAGTASSVTIKGATGANTVTTTAAAPGAVTNVSVVGQNGNDTITADTVDTGSVTAVLADGKNTVSATGLTIGTLVVTGGSGIDTVTAGAALTSGVINLNLGDGANVMNLRVATDALVSTLTATTGTGDDTLNFSGSLGTNDVLTWTAGAGTDTLVLATAGADLSDAKVTLDGVEVIQVKDAAGVAATISSSLLSGKTITVKADAHTGTDTKLVVEGLSDTTTIDLSTVTIDKSITNAIDLVEITSATATSAVTITGTSTADTITGGAKGDTIVAGNGEDTITGGAGNDTINITETTANQVKDTILFETAATNGQDTIIGFKSGTDKLSLVNADTTAGTVAGAAAVDYFSAALTNGAAAYAIGTGAGGTLTTATADVVVISTTLSSKGDLDLSSTGTELLKALSSTDTAATQLDVVSASKFYLVAYQDNKAYLYHANAGAGDTAVTASEITLVGTINDITAGSLIGTGVANDFLIQ